MFQIKQYEKLECVEERRKLAREIYDNFIMKELLSHSHVSLLVFYAFCFGQNPFHIRYHSTNGTLYSFL